MFESIEACQQCEPIGLPGQSYCRDCGLRTAPTSPSLNPTRIRTARADVTQHVRSRVHRMTARAATARRGHATGQSSRRPAGPVLLRQAVARVGGRMILPARRRRR